MEVYSHALPLYPCLTKRAALSVSDLCDAKTMSSGSFSFHTLLCMGAHA